MERKAGKVRVKAKNVRVYRIDPAMYISHRKAILEALADEAGMTDEEVDALFREFRAEPWSDDPGVLDAVINRIASRLGIVVQYEFAQ
jgi:hypothetical protein